MCRLFYLPCSGTSVKTISGYLCCFNSIKTTALEWFKNWFDSPYYHLLYRHRNLEEAAFFIDNLLRILKPPKGSRILDLACGKGRHSYYLSQKGYDVTGVDLSENSIKSASKIESNHLRFFRMDMRKLTFSNEFDIVMNLFTSFGYFDNKNENLTVLHGVNRALVNGGTFIIDFLNAWKVIHTLVPEEKKTVDGVRFCINRSFEDGMIIKMIDIDDHGKKLHFEERVQAITPDEFDKMLQQTGFEVTHRFGNYDMQPFEHEIADRLIIFAKKR